MLRLYIFSGDVYLWSVEKLQCNVSVYIYQRPAIFLVSIYLNRGLIEFEQYGIRFNFLIYEIFMR
jgi:hypothetical protein